jgi:DNA polymerase-3 subunit delta'
MATAEALEIPRLDKVEGWPAPEERAEWFGEPAAERTLLEAYRGGRMHHAWLIGGPKGIGKATLAYRFARFALAHPDPDSPDVAAATDLSVARDHPAFRKVAVRAHPNLLALERPWDEKNGRYKTELTVDEIRRTISFFGSTGGEPGWRIGIVDPADEMNASAANALLKVLEEPPTRALFFIVSHAPGRLLPTIRSRCRRLELLPLPPEVIARAIREGAADRAAIGDADLTLAAKLAEGSLRRAILLLEDGGIETYRSFARLLARLPDLDIPAMHAFADSVSGRSAEDAYESFLDHLRQWLGRRVRRESEPDEAADPSAAVAGVPLARWAEVWEKVNRSAAEAEALNLDRKQVVLSIFMTLARATRM